ncbi:glutaminyl-peptide cyclotransferase-like protein [Drosophila miranda]|uniref:glutaminyl-peptide cyclotransferase-like protein n=1 Tax=Drosophila miranda TaxID=7229 RepID=UPI0007E82EF6|nr:glutaminyl-peptide cyclotransferase-like protein [Drosophila miranda]
MPVAKHYVVSICLALLLTGAHSFKEVLIVGRNGTMRYEPAQLTVEQMRSFAGLSDPEHLRQTVHRLAVRRVVGTPGHAAVRDFIIDSLRALGWHVNLDIFNGQLPILGSVTFHNIVARLSCKARRYLMLGCHYDSKYLGRSEYVGATDAAVSCALMLNMARVLQKQLRALRQAQIGLLFVFFDGTEAIGSWSDEDSLYGSRHLADLMYERSLLDSIDLFVLLDRVGAKDVSFFSHIPSTVGWFQRLVQLEQKLSKAGLLKAQRSYFQFIARDDPRDDHVPFLRHQVPVLHLTAEESSTQVWHKVTDVEARVDYGSTEQVALIVRLFVLEYLLSAPSSSGQLLPPCLAQLSTLAALSLSLPLPLRLS